LCGIFSYVNFSDRLFVHPKNGEGIVQGVCEKIARILYG